MSNKDSDLYCLWPSGFASALEGCQPRKREFTVDQQRLHKTLMALAALVAASAVSGNAAAQVSSTVATVSLVATVPPGVSFVPAPAGRAAAVQGSAVQPGFSLAVNASYRLQARTALSPGAAVTLPSDGRPGLLELDRVRGSLEAVGIDAAAFPVTVELIITPAL